MNTNSKIINENENSFIKSSTCIQLYPTFYTSVYFFVCKIMTISPLFYLDNVNCEILVVSVLFVQWVKSSNPFHRQHSNLQSPITRTNNSSPQNISLLCMHFQCSLNRFECMICHQLSLLQKLFVSMTIRLCGNYLRGQRRKKDQISSQKPDEIYLADHQSDFSFFILFAASLQSLQ